MQSDHTKEKYQSGWLSGYILTGTVLLVISQYLPKIELTTEGIKSTWFWEYLFFSTHNYSEFASLFLVLIPFIVLKYVPEKIIAACLLFYFSFLLMTHGLSIQIISINNLIAYITPAGYPPVQFLVFTLIFSIFLFSSLCRLLPDYRYPYLLQRFVCIYTIVLFIIISFSAPQYYLHPKLAKVWSDTWYIPVISGYIVLWAIAGILQSFKLIPNIVFVFIPFPLLIIVVFGLYKSIYYIANALMSEANVVSESIVTTKYFGVIAYKTLLTLIAASGLLVLIWSCITYCCLQLSNRSQPE